MRHILSAVLFSSLIAPDHVEPTIWAKHATALPIGSTDSPCAPQGTPIVAPDGHTSVEVLCRSKGDESAYSVRVRSAAGLTNEAQLREGAREILWSPDSTTFLVNGSLSAYTGFFVDIYRFKAGELTRTDITPTAQRDMVSSFPPCKAWNRDGDKECKEIAADPHFNMSGVRWTTDSSAVDVIAEVPCSSSYSGIMCQVKGYELGISDGRILRSFAAKKIPEIWKTAMAWKLRIPEPPKYGAANVTFPPSH